MGQVYLEDYEGPLYAFVEFKVGNLTVVNTEEGQMFDSSESYSLNHVTNFDMGDTYITNVVMSFSYTKESSVMRGGKSWAIGAEFNISVFDESAIFVEDIIANAIENMSYGANCYIEYGWSANGTKIDERCCSFEGMLQEYTLSFEGSSTVLSIVGTITSVVYMATTYISGGEQGLNNQVTQSGKPSAIVEYIAENIWNNNGEGITYVCDDVVETQVYYEHTDTKVPRNFPCYNKSISKYITEDLCRSATSVDGRAGYIFYLTDDEDDPKIKHVHFRPQTSVDNTYGTINENGETTIDLGGAGNNDGEITREYNYYAGFQNGEVLSYSSEFKGFAVSGGCRFSSAVDGTTNEMIACETADTGEGGSYVSPSSACRVLGLSSASYQGLDLAMRDLWNKYATQVYGASIEIMGDPNINVMDIIKLNVYTKYNLPHHTSGEYIVMSIDESLDSSGYTSTLNLMKKDAVQDLVTQQLQEGEGISGGVDYNPKVSGIDVKSDPRFMAPSNPVVNNKDGSSTSTRSGYGGMPSNIPASSVSSSSSSVNVQGKSSTSASSVPSSGKEKGSSDVANPIVY